MIWRNIRVEDPYKKSRQNKYKPARSDRSLLDTSLTRQGSKEKKEQKTLNSCQQIPFQYTVSTEWIIRLQKSLKGLFKEFRCFCSSIEKQMEKMNSKYRRITELFSEEFSKKCQDNSVNILGDSKNFGIWQSIEISKLSPVPSDIGSPSRAKLQKSIKHLKSNSFSGSEQLFGLKLSESKVLASSPVKQQSKTKQKLKEQNLKSKEFSNLEEDNLYQSIERLAEKLEGVNKVISEKKKNS